ncbi:MAG: substrate-binding domain-containing protein [Christensenellaceae bacterium]|jgi:phosphate transport system substrate-binding protein|nr:substrate-binding domain-containing protein [Christensenellaceae bacterium]
MVAILLTLGLPIALLVLSLCLKKPLLVRISASLLCLLALIVLWLLANLTLPSLIGPPGFYLAHIWPGALLLLALLLVWRPFSLKIRRISILSLAGAVVLASGLLMGEEMRKRVTPAMPESEINLDEYAPYALYGGEETGHFTKVKLLPEESSLRLSGDLPRLDGATALYPVYSAFARASYPKGNYDPYAELREGNAERPAVVCSRTETAFLNLVEGHADIAFLGGVSQSQRLLAEQAGLELTLTPIGREAFVFFVSASNPVNGLSLEQIKGVYGGEITNWGALGGAPLPIRAYQRAENSGSQTALRKLMGETPLMAAPKEDVVAMMGGMVSQVADFRGYGNALGYSFRFYAQEMANSSGLKFLAIEGVEPTRASIADGSYPLADSFFAVTAKRDGLYLCEGLSPERARNIEALLAFALSAQGQYLVEETGYVPLPVSGE